MSKRTLLFIVLLAALALAGARADQLPESRAGALVPVPEPDLSRLEEGVRERLDAARAQLALYAGRPGAELADAYGDLGKLYHAHHVNTAAEAAYRNARVLAPESFEWAFLLGYLYRQTDRPEQAVAQLEDALELRPEDPYTRYRLAEALLDLHRPAEATLILEPVQDMQGLAAGVAYALGRAALAQRRFEEAARHLEAALAAQPQAAKVHYPLAMAYRHLGEVERARAHLERYGDAEPTVEDPYVADLAALAESVRSHLLVASRWVRSAGRYDLAAEAYREALAIEPDHLTARIGLARSLQMLGDLDGAAEHLEKALATAPDDPEVHLALGMLLDQRGEEDDALAHYRRAVAADPDHRARTYLGHSLMRRGEYRKAAEQYARAVQANPQDLIARWMQAAALTRAGDHAAARGRLEAALERVPGDPRFTQALARLLAASPDPAVRDGQRALDLAERLYAQDDSIRNGATLAAALAEQGRYPQAVELAQAALDLAPFLGAYPLIPNLQSDLEAFQAGRPSRVPWLDDPSLYRPAP
jgi:tetratricopeptide (TPR) repeat protein